MSRAVGVDWGSNGWVCASVDDTGEWVISLQPSILSVWREYRDSTDLPILVDIPIGLVQNGTRNCDQQAKESIAGRGNSVFLTPPREALRKPTYEEAKSVTEQRTAHSLTTQAWRLLPRIQEVDDFLQSQSVLEPPIYESHPEVCFQQLAADDRTVVSKHDSEGIARRKDILEQHKQGTADAYDTLVARHIENQPSHGRRFRASNADDILDAMGLAVTSLLAGGTFERFGGEERDHILNRDIEIVYSTG